MKNTIEILDNLNIKYDIIDDKIYLKYVLLNLTYKNLIGVLDVSMIENLEKLWCYNNNLSKIICNEKLKYLDCSYNKLTEIVCNENLKNLFVTIIQFLN